MRIIQQESVYQLTFMPYVFPVNCYLIEEKDSLTLVDTAMPSCEKSILRTAEKIGKPITKIILTHPHSDHIGSLDSLKKVLTDVPVYISERDALLLTGNFKLQKSEPDLPIRGGFSKGLKTEADILLHDTDEIGSLLAIEVPGHTPGSMAFLDKRSKILIAGDAFQTRGGMAVAGDRRLLFPFPAMATWSIELAIKSAEKLQSYPIAVLAAGHGNMLYSPSDAIQSAIRQAQSRLDKGPK